MNARSYAKVVGVVIVLIGIALRTTRNRAIA